MVHGTVVCTVAISFPVFQDPSTTLILGGALITVAYLSLGVWEGWRAPLWFSPLSFYLLWSSIGLGAAAIYTGAITATGEPIQFSVAMVSPTDIVTAYLIWLAGSVALHAGIELVRPIRSDGVIANGTDIGSGGLLDLIVLFAVGIFAVWSPTWITPLGAPGTILPWISWGALCSLALRQREQFRLSRTVFNLLLGIGTLGLFIVNFASGSKRNLMYAFFPLLWLFVVRKPLRRWLPLLAVVMIVLYLTVVVPIITLARIGGPPSSRSYMTLVREVLQSTDITVGDITTSPFLLAELGDVLGRMFEPSALGYIVEEAKSYGLQFGATMDYAWYAFIPRVVWPDKPIVVRAVWFADYVGQPVNEEGYGTALAMTAPGELYWNFGPVGVLFGMFILGCGLGGLWRMAGVDPRRKPVRLTLYVLVMLNIAGWSEAVTISSAIVSIAVTFSMIFVCIEIFRAAARASHATVAS
jgi:hypothetical protein